MRTRSWSANSIESDHTAGTAGWPGPILVPKANHFRFKQGKVKQRLISSQYDKS